MSDGVGQRGAEDEENVQRESRKEGEERVTVGDMVLDDGGSDSHERAREFLETECWNGDVRSPSFLTPFVPQLNDFHNLVCRRLNA
eukprot:1413588-Rhodomonas_salina.2